MRKLRIVFRYWRFAKFSNAFHIFIYIYYMLLYIVTSVQFGKNPLKDQNDSVIANTIFKS